MMLLGPVCLMVLSWTRLPAFGAWTVVHHLQSANKADLLTVAAQLQANIDVLKRHDPVAAQSLLHTQQLPQSQFDALMELQNQPAGTSREAFVQQAVQHMLVWETAWQCASFEQVSQHTMRLTC